jgi:hypothetical protein
MLRAARDNHRRGAEVWLKDARKAAYSAMLPHVLPPAASDWEGGPICNDSGNGFGPTSTTTTFGEFGDSGILRCSVGLIGLKPSAATIPLSFRTDIRSLRRSLCCIIRFNYTAHNMHAHPIKERKLR